MGKKWQAKTVRFIIILEKNTFNMNNSLIEKSNNNLDESNHSNENDKSLKRKNNSDKFIQINKDIVNESDYEDMIKYKLKKIFELYCKDKDRTNIEIFMKPQKFIKFLADSEIFDHKINKVKAELVFKSETQNKNQLHFKQFLHILIKISEIKYEDLMNLTKKEILNLLLENHILPLFDRLYLIDPSKENLKKTFTLKNQVNDLESYFEFDQESEQLFTFISHILYDIYKIYFPLELSLSEHDEYIKEESHKSFIKFLKEYEITPYLVDKLTAFNLFRLELDTEFEIKDLYFTIVKNLNMSRINKEKIKNIFGKYFNFFKFLRVLGRIAQISYNDIEVNISRKLSLFEKICLTLERMEQSEGLSILTAKQSSTKNLKKSRIIPKEILERIKKNIFLKKEVISVFIKEYLTINQLERITSRIEDKNNKSDNSNYILDKYGTDLIQIFKYYCSSGDFSNSVDLKPQNFYKLIRDSGLITSNNSLIDVNIDKSIEYIKLSNNDIDIIYFKMCNLFKKPSSVNNNDKKTSFIFKNDKPKQSRFSFTTFIKTIEVISQLILPNNEILEAIDIICQNNLMPLIKKTEKSFIDMSILKEKRRNKNLVNLCYLLHKTFLPIYNFYADSKTNLLSFEKFLKYYEYLIRFCTDFEIFPGLICKSKLYSFFTTISSYMTIHDKFGNESNKVDKYDTVDDNYFIDVLTLISSEIYKEKTLSSEEKILSFVERLSNSEGLMIITKEKINKSMRNENVDIITPFKVSFPDYFKIKIGKKDDFFDILKHKL